MGYVATGSVSSDVVLEGQNISIHRKLVGRRLGGSFAADEATPRFMALVNDFCSIFLVLGLARESELVLGLAIRDFVDTARIGQTISVGRVWAFWKP